MFHFIESFLIFSTIFYENFKSLNDLRNQFIVLKGMVTAYMNFVILLLQKIEYIRIDGKTNALNRQALVDKFTNTNNCLLAILSITAAGTGKQSRSNKAKYTDLMLGLITIEE